MRSVRSIGALLTSVLLAACSTIDPPQPHTPYFRANGNDSKWQGLLRKESPLTSKCASKNTCDHVFFIQALAALYDSRESAVRYFEKVIAVAPKGQLAASSKLWLRLLHSGEAPADQSWLRSILTAPATAEQHTLLSQAIERVVHDLLDRELTIQQLRAMQDLDAQSAGALQRELQDQEKRTELFNSRRDSARMPVEPAALQNLQRQLSDRDKKIEELSGQLEALKRIDQEMREKTRPIKPPSNVLPLQPSEPSKP